MKRLIGILAVLLCLAIPAMAVEGSFVPSIDYKDGPEIEDAEIEDEDVVPCLVITSIPEAREKTTNIHQPLL